MPGINTRSWSKKKQLKSGVSLNIVNKEQNTCIVSPMKTDSPQESAPTLSPLLPVPHTPVVSITSSSFSTPPSDSQTCSSSLMTMEKNSAAVSSGKNSPSPQVSPQIQPSDIPDKISNEITEKGTVTTLNSVTCEIDDSTSKKDDRNEEKMEVISSYSTKTPEETMEISAQGSASNNQDPRKNNKNDEKSEANASADFQCFELSKRTSLKIFPQKQLQFEIGPMVPDPDHINTLINFPQSAFKKLVPLMKSLEEEFSLLDSKQTSLKKHIIYQWYVQMVSKSDGWKGVNILSINRGGKLNYNMCVFLTEEEWQKLCYWTPQIQKKLEVFALAVVESGQKKAATDKLYTLPKDGHFFQWKYKEIEPKFFFFSDQHALAHAKLYLGKGSLQFGELELIPVLHELPCLATFLLECYMFHIFKEVSLAFYKPDPTLDAHEIPSFPSISTEQFEEYMQGHVFPKNYLEKCFSNFFYMAGVIPPPWGVNPYLSCMETFISMDDMLDYFFTDGPLNLPSDDLSPGVHFLRIEMFYSENPDMEKSKLEIYDHGW